MYMPDAWIEVNLFPPSRDDRIKVLLEVIDPLVHDTLGERISSWHYGQYADSNTLAADGKNMMWDFLKDKKERSILVDFYEGSHGAKGATYPGEEDEFGTEMWNATYRFWESQSEYALTLLKNESAKSRSKHDLPWHWEKNVHLFSNRLLLSYADEAYLSLQRARAYLPTTDNASQAIKQTQREMGRARIGTGAQARPLLTESVQKMFNDELGP